MLNTSLAPVGGVDSAISRRLESWKEIASYLDRSRRTVRRWEDDEGLPIHRHRHAKGSTVFAYADELDRWLMSRVSRHEGVVRLEDIELPDKSRSMEEAMSGQPVAARGQSVSSTGSQWVAGSSFLALLMAAFALVFSLSTWIARRPSLSSADRSE